MNSIRPMRSTSFEMVSDFQREVLGNRFPATPQPPADKDYAINCLDEELTELVDALETNDMAAAADALADLVYFALGISYQMGINFDEVFRIVHVANLKKQRGVTKRGYDGNAGDAVKPADWVDPKEAIRALLYAPQR